MKDEDSEEIKGEVGRSYQIALCEFAKKRNCIICLPTGAGKTYIAIQLIKHYLPDAIEKKKKIVFLVTTKMLVHQQAEYIRDQIFLKLDNERSKNHVTELTGDLNVDFWDDNKWKTIINNTYVFVMTAQILQDALSHNYIMMSQLNLMIFDECHHTDKDHVMARIMDKYKEKIQYGDYERPRILGLTATIITGNMKKNSIAQEVRDIEEKMCATAVTYHDYEEVLKHSTKADVQMFTFSCRPEDDVSTFITPEIDDTIDKLRELGELLESDISAQIKAVDSEKLIKEEQVYNKKKSIAHGLMKVLKDVKKLCEQDSLGIYGARLAALLKRAFIETEIGEDDENLENLLIVATDTCLARVIAEYDRIAGDWPKTYQISDYVSPKVTKLLNIFYDWQQKHGKENQLCAIVFCTERLTAQMLTWIFQDAIQHCGDKYAFIKPGFAVGSASTRAGYDLAEQRVTTKKLDQNIKAFHRKEINLLFATNVLEEGLNVPGCNVVLRFDPILHYPSYVQSMGRARKRGALFGVLTSDKNVSTIENRIEEFKKINIGLANYLRVNAYHVDEDEVDHEAPPAPSSEKDDLRIDPKNPDSPTIKLTDAVQKVHQYCQLLKCDLFVTMEPFAWWEDVSEEYEEKPMFRAYVQLPSNAVFRYVIKGSAQKTKNEAKRQAFLSVCKEMYKFGALNERLLPCVGVLPEKVTCFLKEMENRIEKSATSAESTKVMHWYSKKKPRCIEEVSSDEPFSVYVIKIKLIQSTSESKEHLNLYNFEARRRTLALLSKVVLTDIPPGYLNGRHGELTFSYEKVTLESNVENEDLVKLKRFQKYLFSKILKVNHHLMKGCDDNPIYVCPLVQEENGKWRIDSNLLVKLDNIDEGLFETKLTETARGQLTLQMEEFEDAVVVPWYKNVKELEYYCVCDVRKDLSIDSPIEAKDPHSSTFALYYSHKYELKIMHPTKPLLSVASLGKQLNYLTKKKDPTKMTKEERQDNRYSSSIQTLIPEFVKIHPLPASLLVQARFLPSILHQTHRLLLSREIQLSVAQLFHWKTADTCKDGRSKGLTIINDSAVTKDSSSSVSKPSTSSELDVMAVRTKTIELLSLANFGQLGLPENKQGPPSSPVKKRKTEEESPKLYNIEQMHLDYVHPERITNEHIQCFEAFKGRQTDEAKEVADDAVYENEKFSPKKCSYHLEDMKDIQCPDIDEPTDFTVNTGPTADAIMEAITLANANDAVNLENLEVIGDSFLKFCVSTHVFSELPNENEGAMTQLRTKLISNRHLFFAASNKNLGEYLSGGIFIPETSWLPLGETLPNVAIQAAGRLGKNFDIFDEITLQEMEDMSVGQLVSKIETSEEMQKCHTPPHTSYTHSRIPNKRVADCVEALIGVYYMNSGIDGAFRAMDWLGLRAPNSLGESVAYKRCSPIRPPVEIPEGSAINRPEQLLPLIDELEELIQYKFNDRWLVVEAFSHPGYLKNTVTGCFQRLEFLGDAVLDFLVTDHIFKNGLAKTPGAVTDLRSALVNNVTFGSLAIRYGLDKFLLLICKELQEVIDSFKLYQDENGHAVTGHFKLLNDLEVSVAEDIDVPKVLGDLFESLAGAVYLDCNMCLNTTWRVFYRLMKNEIEQFAKVTPKAPIRDLYEKIPGITFRSYDNEENNTESRFNSYALVSVTIKKKTYYGRGTSKKLAKQAAAKYALRSMSG